MRQFTAILLAVTVLGVVGCGGSGTAGSALKNSNQTNMQRLANLYMKYQMSHKFNGPKDEASFKAYLKTVKPESLESMSVDPAETDALFICDSDGEPFVIKYGIRGSSRGSQEAAIFQASGSGGKRMVGFLNMSQRSVDDDEYETLLGTKPAKSKKRSKSSDDR
ncbi:MAG: hypothetical protein ACI814_000953 [Mariniblastus sp.]|jgi:hypothetical protein